MAKVLSVSVPDSLYDKWQESGLDIKPSAIFQTALETELGQSNQMLLYWSTRALNAEKRLRVIADLVKANDTEVKRFLLLQGDE